MTVLRPSPGSTRPLLTRVPLSTESLPPLSDPMVPWPGREIDLGVLRVHLRETPGPAEGTPAFYVHGLGGSATNWTELAGQLAGRSPGYAIDLPGFGRSRPGSRTRARLVDLASVVVNAISAISDRPVHLFGNSMGGAISLLVAAERPDLVRTLTLISPAVPDLRPDVRRLSDPRVLVAALPVIGRQTRRALAAATAQERTERMLRLCFAEPEKVSAARIALATDEVRERDDMPWSTAALTMATGALFRAWLTVGERSLWRVVHRVGAPTLVIWGDRDRLVSVRKAPRTATSLPNGRLLVLRHTGHVAQMERPTTVARAALGMWDAVADNEW
jgi:pimeloyl-ACP methyl ester carboxylesterase